MEETDHRQLQAVVEADRGTSYLARSQAVGPVQACMGVSGTWPRRGHRAVDRAHGLRVSGSDVDLAGRPGRSEAVTHPVILRLLTMGCLTRTHMIRIDTDITVDNLSTRGPIAPGACPGTGDDGLNCLVGIRSPGSG